jgi:hypothetical protein
MSQKMLIFKAGIDYCTHLLSEPPLPIRRGAFERFFLNNFAAKDRAAKERCWAEKEIYK